MKLRVLQPLNIRQGPDPNSPSFGTLKTGFIFDAAQKITGVAVDGNDQWYVDANGFCYWSGDVEEFATLPENTPRDSTLGSKLDWGGKLLGIDQIWANFKTKGNGLKVAILDLGLDDNHPEFANAVVPGGVFNFADSANPANVNDFVGHGTNCAGIVAAQGVGQVVGIAPEAKMLIGKLKRSNLDPLDGNTLAKAIRWAVRNGAKVISISQSVAPTADSEAAIDEAIAQNVCIVAAIGNQVSIGTPKTVGVYPATNPKVISVGAIDKDGNLSPITIPDPSMKLTAPGIDILTTGIAHSYTPHQSGTSLAAPLVAAVIALMLSHRPDLTPAKIEAILVGTAKPAATSNGFGYRIVQPLTAFSKLQSEFA